MNFIHSNIARLLFFITVTILEVLLGIFLLIYGHPSLKLFAVLLLSVQLFSFYRIHFYTSNILTYRRY